PEIPGQPRARFDVVGFILTGFGILAFVTGSTAVGLGDIAAPEALMIAGIGIALIVGYLWHSRHNPDPLADSPLFPTPSTPVAIGGGAMVRSGSGGPPFLLPLVMQYGFGMTPFQSGAVTFVGAIGAIGLKTISRRLIRLFGFRTLLLVNAGFASLFIAIP